MSKAVSAAAFDPGSSCWQLSAGASLGRSVWFPYHCVAGQFKHWEAGKARACAPVSKIRIEFNFHGVGSLLQPTLFVLLFLGPVLCDVDLSRELDADL